MKEEIRKRLEEVLPLSDMYGIELDRKDVTPKNFKSLDSLVELVKTKLSENAN